MLEVAGLGDDVDRKVRTYSQGMRARIAIAQAMLGLPELLVLDEPTNGLDPPQIREVREVLRTYAETGRTVVVSSHLLAEVERTCTHVVVMHRGELVAAGPLDQVVAADGDDDSAADLEIGVPRPDRSDMSSTSTTRGVHDLLRAAPPPPSAAPDGSAAGGRPAARCRCGSSSCVSGAAGVRSWCSPGSRCSRSCSPRCSPATARAWCRAARGSSTSPPAAR